MSEESTRAIYDEIISMKAQLKVHQRLLSSKAHTEESKQAAMVLCAELKHDINNKVQWLKQCRRVDRLKQAEDEMAKPKDIRICNLDIGDGKACKKLANATVSFGGGITCRCCKYHANKINNARA